MKNNRFILLLMMWATIVLLIVPLIPHHHDGGLIHLSYNIDDSDTPCSKNHQESHSDDDSCCNDTTCKARFKSHAASMECSQAPHHFFIAILFDDYAIRRLLSPQKQGLAYCHHYIELLHGTNITSAFALRWPPHTL